MDTQQAYEICQFIRRKGLLSQTIIITMKKHLGILRNRTDRLVAVKHEAQRKKNRFQIVGKEDSEDYNTFTLTTTHSDPASQAELADDTDEYTKKAFDLHFQARNKMKKVSQIRKVCLTIEKKMGELSKARQSCLREKENQKYDEGIAKLAGEATSSIMAAQGLMRQIANIGVATTTSKKILTSMQASLASEIQQSSRSLRSQEKEYFQRVKSYEGTVNSAIQLTAEQRKTMEGEWQQLQESHAEESQNGRVSELVNSISKLSSLYKDLNNLVVTQGTVIDRIDFNLQATEQHTAKAVVHLVGADTHASSAFADKIIRALAITIILMAVILGIKYMK